MNKDAGVFWIIVAVLLGAGLLLGQFAPVAVGAMAAAILAHQRLKHGTRSDFDVPGLSPSA